MPVNLLNEKALNQYLYDIVFHGQINLPITNDNTMANNIPYIEDNISHIVNGMVLQYFKHRIRAYLVNYESFPYLVKVTPDYPDLPAWAQTAVSKNNPVFEFKRDLITPDLQSKIITICQFLQLYAEDYLQEQIAEAKNNHSCVHFRFDYLKTNNQFATIENTLQFAKQNQFQLSQRISKRKRERETELQLLSGTEFVTNLSDGYKVLLLTTPEALDVEAAYMHHCVGNGYFDTKIAGNNTQIYSIRDKNNKPHVTMEIKNNTIIQCMGKGNVRPNVKYFPLIYEFVAAQRFEMSSHTKNVGILHQDNEYYNIFNLPKGLIVKGNLSYSDFGLERLPDLSEVIVMGNFSCTGNQLISLKGAPKMVIGDFNCGYNKLKTLEGCPQKIGGDFFCTGNQLSSLIGGPTYVGRHYGCGQNRLLTLTGAPRQINGTFTCSRNHLSNLQDGPESVRGLYFCSNNPLRDLLGAPLTATEIVCQNTEISKNSVIPTYVFKYTIKGIDTFILSHIKQSIGPAQKISNQSIIKSNISNHSKTNHERE